MIQNGTLTNFNEIKYFLLCLVFGVFCVISANTRRIFVQCELTNRTSRMTSLPPYNVSQIQEGDAEAVMILLKKTFFIDEPLNAAVGLCSDFEGECLCPELEEYCTHSLFEGTSLKATDSDGNIVGVMISGLCPLKEEDNGNDLLSQAEKCQNPKFKKILYILARREEGAMLWKKFPQEQSLAEVKVAATDPRWRRRGIMNDLLRETEKLVKQRNISLLRMDTSSAYSAKSAERMGFTCVYKALYINIKMDGRPLIVPEPPHVDDRVYIKRL